MKSKKLVRELHPQAVAVNTPIVTTGKPLWLVLSCAVRHPLAFDYQPCALLGIGDSEEAAWNEALTACAAAV